MPFPLAWNPILVPSSETWRLQGGSRSGGRSLTGSEQVVVGPTGWWTASLTIPLNTRAKILAFRGMIAALDGRAGTVLVGPSDVRQGPTTNDVNPQDRVLMFHAAAADADLNATEMLLTRIRGGALLPGQHFSVNEHLHIISSVPNGESAGAGPFLVRFRPWLRQGVTADTPVDFRRPVCTMQLGSDDTGGFELQLGRFGTVTLELVEAF